MLTPPRPRTRTCGRLNRTVLAFGCLSVGASSAMLITALSGPGWMDMSQRRAAILGGLSLPVALAGAGMIAGGAKSARKFDRWASNNSVSPPKSGNHLLVIGTVVSLTGVGGIAAGTQQALTSPTPARSDWAIVGVSGVASAIGLAILAGGMITRSKFAVWERSTQLQPGPMSLKGGGGLSIAGRF